MSFMSRLLLRYETLSSAPCLSSIWWMTQELSQSFLDCSLVLSYFYLSGCCGLLTLQTLTTDGPVLSLLCSCDSSAVCRVGSGVPVTWGENNRAVIILSDGTCLKKKCSICLTAFMHPLSFLSLYLWQEKGFLLVEMFLSYVSRICNPLPLWHTRWLCWTLYLLTLYWWWNTNSNILFLWRYTHSCRQGVVTNPFFFSPKMIKMFLSFVSMGVLWWWQMCKNLI